MSPRIILAIALYLLYPCPSTAASSSAEAIASQFSLTTSTTIPFPSATQKSSDAQSFIVSNWSLSKGKIQNGASDLAFVDDPFPDSPSDGVTSSNTTGPVLQVTYPANSFSHNTGGAQFLSLWNTTDGSNFQSMMISYELTFDSGFNWVQGGKLPGLRGGLNPDGCSGGNEPNGTDCFSTRLMWRKNGAGEVYAYIPTPNNLCSDNNIICNPDFGVSVGRASFSFASGQWNRVTILVQLNNPPDVANGQVMVFYNDVQAISQQNLQFRSSTNVNAGGMYFSTFFGGDDSSWATPVETHTYFRNLRLWGSYSPSVLSGSKVSAASVGLQCNGFIFFIASTLFILIVGLI